MNTSMIVIMILMMIMMTMMNSNDLLILVAINDGDLVPVVAPFHVSFVLGEIRCEKN